MREAVDRIQMKKDQTVISKLRLKIIIISIAVYPILWWIFLLCFPVISRKKYDLFLFDDFEQKLYWYVFETSELLIYVLMCWVIHKWNSFYDLQKLTKWLYLYQIFRVVEYWLFHGTIPLLPFIIALCMLSVDLYRVKRK